MKKKQQYDNKSDEDALVEEEDVGNPIMDNPFDPSLINIDLKSPTIFNLIDRLSQTPPEIDIYTEFQRRDDLWDEVKQSRLIESILIKFPLPAFYFDGTDDNKWLVVDGLQRLSALRNFIIKGTLKLTGLEFLKNLEGKFYNELTRPLKRTIDTTQVTAHIINPGTPTEVKFNIFKRINTGGLVLTSQEIRHALNQGMPAVFVGELASLQEFKDATENKINASRLLDREFVTRFTAFYLNSPSHYSGELDSFLNSAMSQIGSLSRVEIKTIKQDFKQAMSVALKIFGTWAFRKADQYPHKRKPISKVLFEVWSVCLAKLTQSDREKMVQKKEKVMENFVSLCKNNSAFFSSITSGTGKKSNIEFRFKAIQALIKDVLND